MKESSKDKVQGFGCLAILLIVVGYFAYTAIRVDYPFLIGEEFREATYQEAVDYFVMNTPKDVSGSSWENSLCYNEDYVEVQCQVMDYSNWKSSFEGSVQKRVEGSFTYWCGDYFIYDTIDGAGFSRTDCFTIKYNPGSALYDATPAVFRD